MTQIFFWENEDEYGCFSNFYPSLILVDGKEWATVEHYFQAQKTELPELREEVRCAATPLAAKRLGRKLEIRGDWEELKYAVMCHGLRKKFDQHPDLKKVLVGTGDAEIYEDSPFDKIWGTGQRGGVGTGQNLLGKALMQIREEYRSEHKGT